MLHKAASVNASENVSAIGTTGRIIPEGESPCQFSHLDSGESHRDQIVSSTVRDREMRTHLCRASTDFQFIGRFS